jgi:hypothetical protein
VLDTFHQQTATGEMDPRKGKVKETVTYDTDGTTELQSSETNWLSSTVNGMDWVHAESVTKTVGSAVQTTAYEYATDHQNNAQYGNLTHVREYSDARTTLYRTTETSYYPQTGASYIVGLPAEVRLWEGDVYTPTIGTTCTSQVRNYYDDNASWESPPSVGKLAHVRQATGQCSEDGSAPAAAWVISDYTYDTWGNQLTASAPYAWGGSATATTTTTYSPELSVRPAIQPVLATDVDCGLNQ